LQALEYVTPGTKIGVYLMRMSPDYQRRLEKVAYRRKLHLSCDSRMRWSTGLREIVAQARAVVVPSQWWVPSENVVYEAMLLGKPVILSQIGGNAELVDEGETGLFFQARDARGLANCMNRLAADYDFAERLGTTAYRRARERFGPETFLATIEAAYEEVIGLSNQVNKNQELL
jgi:glycosyltransferase involved in cell wall biosynthesis